MKETRNLNISFCQNGKSNQQTGRLVLPTNWLRLLGISESFKKVEVTYEDGSITIKKRLPTTIFTSKPRSCNSSYYNQ